MQKKLQEKAAMLPGQAQTKGNLISVPLFTLSFFNRRNTKTLSGCLVRPAFLQNNNFTLLRNANA